MKNSIILLLLLFLAANTGNAKIHTITNSGFTFSPSTLAITLGDTVIFNLASVHNAVEVDQSTWNANGNTSNGGFSTADGGGMVILNSTGVHYYVCFYHASMGMKGTITVNAVTDVKLANQTIPDRFILMQNYPNPFNPNTTIRYGLASEGRVSIKIYNLAGQSVRELIGNIESAGFHEVNFNADNLASGIYFYRITVSPINGDKEFVDTRKLILLK